MTLGVMALEPEETSKAAAEGTGMVHQSPRVPYSSSTSPLSVTDPSPRMAFSKGTVARSSQQVIEGSASSTHTPNLPRKTVTSALNLLSSLQETIADILSGSDGVEVPLEVIDVFGTEPMRRPNTKPEAAGSMMTSHARAMHPDLAVADGNKEEEAGVGASVLFLGLDKGQPENEERRKLDRVCGEQSILTGIVDRNQRLVSIVRPNLSNFQKRGISYRYETSEGSSCYLSPAKYILKLHLLPAPLYDYKCQSSET